MKRIITLFMVAFIAISALAVQHSRRAACEVVFDFTNAQEIEAMGLTIPEEESTGENITNPFTYKEVTITPYAGTIPVRIWKAIDNGALTLRYYKANTGGEKGGFAVSVPNGNTLTQITIKGNIQLQYTICDNGSISMSSDKKTLTWTPEENAEVNSVKFENNGTSTTNVETLTVQYDAVSGSGTETEYYVVGTDNFFSEGWTASDDNKLSELTTATGVYSRTFTDVHMYAGTILEYKFVSVEGETVVWYPDGENLSYTFNKSGVYDVTFTFDPTTVENTIAATLKSEDEVSGPEKFYFIGSYADGWANSQGLPNLKEMQYNEETQAFEYHVVVSDNDGIYFSFGDIANTDWDDFNANHRYAVGYGTTEIVEGQSLQLVQMSGDENLLSIKVRGVYTIRVTKDLLLSIAKTGEIVNNISEMKDLEDQTFFGFTGEVFVVAKPTTKFVYLKDDTGSSLIYDESGTKTSAADVGKTIAANWTGKVRVYHGLFEVVPDAAIVVKDGATATVTYEEASLDDLTVENVNKVVILRNVTYKLEGNNDMTIYKGDDIVVGYNKFGIDIAAPEEGTTYNVIGAISYYNDKVEFQPITIRKAVEQQYSVSFVNIKNWEKVYAYAWTYNTESGQITEHCGAWPGSIIEKTGEKTIDGIVYDIYTLYVYSDEMPNYVIFNNGESGVGNQTADLPFINGKEYDSLDGPIEVQLGSSGCATLSSEYLLSFANISDVKAYRASEVNNGVVIMAQMEDNVPPYTGIFLVGEPNKIVTIPTSFGGGNRYDNLLCQSVNETIVAPSQKGKYHYVFKMVNGQEGFYPVTDESVVCEAGKAYLELPVQLSVDNTGMASWMTYEDYIQNETGIIHNGDLEGTIVSSFKAKEYGVNEGDPIVDATIVDGEGVDGSRGIVVHAAPLVSESWDSQFWIVFDEPLYEQTKLTVKFDYKASAEAAVEVQAHCNPGEYNYYECGCDVTFKEEWQTFEKTVTIMPSWTKVNGDGDVRGFKSLAFNLAKEEAMTYYFDNIEIKAEIVNLSEPEWINVLLNGNCEGEVETGYIGNMSNWDGAAISERELYSFWCRDAINGEGVHIIDDAGVDGSRCAVVESVDNPSNAWDTQFFITSPHQFKPGQRFRLRFDYRADDYVKASTEIHGLPSGYIIWGGIGDIYFTTEWQTFDMQFTVADNWCIAKEENGTIIADWQSGLFFQTIAFDLNEYNLATRFYFDNIEWSIDDGESGYATDEEREIAEVVQNQVQYEGTTKVKEEEWNLLKSIYLSMENTDGWKQKWDFSGDTYTISSLPGVIARGYHITSINLPVNNLTGTFPVQLLTLPRLESLNLSGNKLSGDLGETMEAYMEANPETVIPVKTLDISNNQLVGNLGLFASNCPSLETLKASKNMFDAVSPMISPNVTNLVIGQQTIDQVMDLHIKDLTAETLIENTPSILLYCHAQQDYQASLQLLLSKDDWKVKYSCYNNAIQLLSVSSQNAYKGESGDVLSIKISNDEGANATFQMRLEFDEGDSNFNGSVNILDLQTTIDYMFEEYTKKPFNFTAANLWKGDKINVQDAVSLVNLLLADDGSASARQYVQRALVSSSDETYDAYAYLNDGKLMINTSLPISAFDIEINSDEEIEMSPTMASNGMICSVKKSGNKTHIIGYSLSGGNLPVGENTICSLGNGTITYMMLADRDANEIKVSVNGETTVVSSVKNGNHSEETFRLSIGAGRAIVIDNTGHKTMVKEANSK